MARAGRLDAPGVAHHVMMRGIERGRIFRSDEDRLDFLARLDRLLPEEGWRCFAWAAMPNHAHLVIQSARGGLSRLMARLNTGYARGFNLRHGRTGYLFQNRFKSRIVRDDADLTGVVVYVLRNPLEARLVSSAGELEAYPWCGLGALMGYRPARRFEAPSACLSLFAPDLQSARERLRHWVSGRVVGEVSLGLGASADVAGSPGARGIAAEVRSIVAWIAVEELGLGRREVGDRLGISPSAVSHAARRGRSLVHRRRLRVEILR